MFKPIRKDGGLLDTQLTATSTTIVKGDALDFASGYVQRATSTAPVGAAGSPAVGVHCVAAESVTTTSTHLPIQVYWVDGADVDVEADCNGTPTQAMVGTLVDLTNASTLNEAASSVKVFLIKKLKSAADKKVIGRFIRVNA